MCKSNHKILAEIVIIKNGTIVDSFNNKEYRSDIKIINGNISQISENIIVGENDTIIDVEGKYISSGFFDLHVHFRDPGAGDAENIFTGSNAAMAGGFTGVALMPNTSPCMDNIHLFNELENRAKDLLVEIHQIPSITRGRKGNTLVDMDSFAENGALGFTDDGSGVQSSEIMKKAFEKGRELNKPMMIHSEDETYDIGVMNEGEVSKKLGRAGISNLVEDTMTARDIHISRHTGGKVHFQHISTKGAVNLIRNAKEEGVNVTCEVTPHHFSLTDKMVETFSTNYKMNPPLRTQEDVDAILEGLKDGTIDAIATDHAPHSKEKKSLDFDNAPFGIIGLETAYNAGIKFLVNTKVLTFMDFIKKLNVNPRNIIGLDSDLIKEGKEANLVIFDTDTTWIADKDKMKSMSNNTCYHNEEFSGKVFGVINKNRISIND